MIPLSPGRSDGLTILVPTGHLAHTPIQDASFQRGVEAEPDAIIADSGSNDIGPYPLGADVSDSPRKWQERDLEKMLVAARQLQVPMIVGSASDTGTDRGVRDYVGMISEIAKRRRLSPFKLAAIYAEQDRASVREHLPLEPLDDFLPLDRDTLDQTDRIVAVMGPEPIISALEDGADVVIAGRACDEALFSAFCMYRGMPRGLSMLLGKTLECASLCAEPFMVNQSVIGVIDQDQVIFEPMHPRQRCTPFSVATHALYERRDPYRLAGPGGALDTSDCRYTAVDERRTRVTGPRFIPDDVYRIKLEGSGYEGEHAMMVLRIADPIILEHLGELIGFSRQRTKEAFAPEKIKMLFHQYGCDPGHAGGSRSGNVGIVVDVLTDSKRLAHEAALAAGRNLLFAESEGERTTASAGGAVPLYDEAVSVQPAYRWTVHHLIPVEDPVDLFRITLETIDGERPGDGGGDHDGRQ